MKKNLLLLGLAILLMAGSLFAETGLLQGQISGPSGALVSNARITLADTDKNIVLQGVADPTGRFSLSVPLGEYELRIDADGFAGRRQMLRVVPGILYLSVTVLPDGADVRSEALQSNANLDAILLTEGFLPMLSDMDSEFAASLGGTRVTGPGMTQVSNPSSSLGGTLGGAINGGQGAGGIGGVGGLGGGLTGAFGGGGGVGGGPAGGAAIVPVGSAAVGASSVVGSPRLSGPGVNWTGPEFIVDGESGRLPPKDQVREVWIDSDPFTAEYSRPGFGRIHVITRSTPPEFHGSATFNFRDEAMDAPFPGFVFRRSYQTRFFHGQAGGALVPRELFASLSMERLGADTGRTVVAATTPSGLVNDEVNTGSADQIFNGRSQYQISERHQLNVNGRFRSMVTPNLGVGGTALREQGRTLTLRGWDVNLREISRLGSNVVHEMRFQVRRDTSDSAPVKEGTTIYVFGGFVGGGTSSRSAYHDTQIQLENLFVRSTPRTTLRLGAQGYRIERNSQYRGAMLGQFTFWNLSDYLAGMPFQYTQSFIDSTQDVRQAEGSVFAQGEWHIATRISVSGGLRYEAQSNVHDYNNIDPRIALAYRAASGWVLRAGLGVFHQRFSVDDASLLAGASGERVPSYAIVNNPAYPDPSLAAASIVYVTNPLVVRDGNLVAPYLEVGALSVEKSFEKGFVVSASVDIVRGMRQFRTRNIDAPYLKDVADPAALTFDEVNQRRPLYPLVGIVNQYESVGFLKARSFSFRGRTPELRVWKIGAQFNGDYTLDQSEDDDGIPVDNYNRRAEWGRTSLTPRHNFWGGAMLRGPWRISLAALALAHSGYPWSTTMSSDFNRDGNFNERPAGARKNGNDGPNSFNLDLRLSKVLSLPKVEATLFAYGQNVFNSRNYTVLGNSTTIGGGLFLGNASARRMELGIRLRL